MVQMLTSGLAAMLVVASLVFAWGRQAEAGGGGWHTPLSDRAATKVEIVDSCFGPTVARVEAGDTVTWVNRDASPHNVYASGQGWSDGKSFDKGASVSVVFERSGVFPYVCTFHPGMVGVVVVGDGLAAESAAPVGAPAPAARDLSDPGEVPMTGGAASAPREDSGGLNPAWAGVAAIGSAVGTGLLAVGLVRRRR